jgi:hypothetical protein
MCTGFEWAMVGLSGASTVASLVNKPKAPDIPAPAAAPDVIAQENQANDAARIASVQKKRLLAFTSPRSLLATGGGAAGIGTQAAVAGGAAAPKSRLGQ